FSIESLIVGDIENYHVVILKSSRELCHVMVVERDLMNLWLGWLTEIGISTTVMIPDVLTLPFLENKWFTVKLDNEWLIR
ncbi:type II secretion system protein GspL, partial [Yersinia proxima]|uniref:type II secretion system protein GspL n=1 Tax=Yersinia proxima TaxID=2890316 RepID=UPI001D12D6BF